MDEARQALEIEGLVFTVTGDGNLRQDEVRQRLGEGNRRLAMLEDETEELRGRLEHLNSLQRLAEATVAKADELAAEIEANARARADELLAACDEELADRRRRFEAETLADVQTARQRGEELQRALEGTLQTLARALQSAGAPALEM